MRFTWALIAVAVLSLVGCGDSKPVKMNRMHAVNPVSNFTVEGKVAGVKKALTVFKAGDVEFTDLTLQDDTGQYTFYYLPADHQRQPVEGDNVKMTVKFVVLDSSFAGGGRAPIVQQFEFK